MTVLSSKYAYVTGSSKGIGKALVDKLLSQGYIVKGLSRSNNFEHPNFQFLQVDLSDYSTLDSFDFGEHDGDVLLVNNAGTLGEIGSVGKLNSKGFNDVLNTNVLAPQILMNKFLDKYSLGNHNYHILNISSGAGKRPIDGWAAYCASKAALDMFAETIKRELDISNMNNWAVHSIAPGVVDTQMQEQIRNTDETKFSSVQKFRDFKSKGELLTPTSVADKLFEVISSPSKFPDNILSVRDY